MKYFWNISTKALRCFFRLYTHPFNIFIRQTLPFIHLCILQLPKPICRSTCLLNNGQHRSKYTQYRQTNRQI